ncbi:MAG: phosphotransferase enzyme family protein [Kofleriaceae bacterium]
MTVPAEIVAAWGWQNAELAPVPGGLINATYAVRIGGVAIAVIQRLHTIFHPSVNFDIDAVTKHVIARGVPVPRLLLTQAGEAWQEHDGRIWRALSWIDGTTVHRVPDPSWAHAGGMLVGRFHRAVSDLEYRYAFVRAGVHDTVAHLGRLAEHVESGADPEAVELGRAIMSVATSLPELPITAKRHCHGDLKISNLLFDAGGAVTAVALLDLDTLGQGTMAFELGDALRSWCNPLGEDAGEIRFELPIFAAAITGFRSVADDLLTRDERTSIVLGLETVCVELSARFAVDVFRDEYFGWDPTRFSSRRAHNLVRARGQLALAAAVRAARQDALDVVLAGA